MKERTPNDRWKWTRKPIPDQIVNASLLAASRWIYRDVVVISALELAEYPSGGGTGPQWHISVSERGARPTPKGLKRALISFDLVGAEEDNHHPGIARHFWMPVDPARRVDCECKTDEATVVEPDGYTWTNPIDGPCRGCEYQRMHGTPCPLHPEGATP